jgi:hypothetical protein
MYAFVLAVLGCVRFVPALGSRGALFVGMMKQRLGLSASPA